MLALTLHPLRHTVYGFTRRCRCWGFRRFLGRRLLAWFLSRWWSVGDSVGSRVVGGREGSLVVGVSVGVLVGVVDVVVAVVVDVAVDVIVAVVVDVGVVACCC